MSYQLLFIYGCGGIGVWAIADSTLMAMPSARAFALRAEPLFGVSSADAASITIAGETHDAC